MRITDIKGIEDAIELYKMKDGDYPLPNGTLTTETISGTTWQVGTFNQELADSIEEVVKLPIDPNTKKPYKYAVSEDRKNYRIIANLEETGEQYVVANKEKPLTQYNPPGTCEEGYMFYNNECREIGEDGCPKGQYLYGDTCMTPTDDDCFIFKYNTADDGYEIITYYSSNYGYIIDNTLDCPVDVVIPKYYNQKLVTKIGKGLVGTEVGVDYDFGFVGRDIDRLYFPSSIEYIDRYAFPFFSGNDALIEVVFSSYMEPEASIYAFQMTDVKTLKIPKQWNLTLGFRFIENIIKY